jgi:hypothetical protein
MTSSDIEPATFWLVATSIIFTIVYYDEFICVHIFPDTTPLIINHKLSEELFSKNKQFKIVYALHKPINY